MAPLTTLEVGGAAQYGLQVQNQDMLRKALAWAAERGLPTFMLGGGSNLLVADAGFAGLVLRLTDARMYMDVQTGRVYAAAGAVWDDLVRDAVAANLAGVECLAGIPGCVGAAPLQNIGAYGQEVADTLVAVHTVDRQRGTAEIMPATALGLGYRCSNFRGAWRDRYAIVGVDLQLCPKGSPSLRYPELQRAVGPNATLAEARDGVLALRRAKSMIYDRVDANHRSAGSFFVNPHVPKALADALTAHHADMPRFAGPPGETKLSAGWLIEHAGLPRGTVRGNVGLSTRHALAIINRGGATAAEVVAFALEIQDRVQACFGVTLRAEPVLLGFSAELTTRLSG